MNAPPVKAACGGASLIFETVGIESPPRQGMPLEMFEIPQSDLQLWRQVFDSIKISVACATFNMGSVDHLDQ